MMRKVILHTDPESTGWVASVPSLPGCFSEGETKEEALANIREAAEGWLEVARNEGIAIPAEDVLVAIDHLDLSETVSHVAHR